MQALIRSKSAGITGGRGTAGAGPGRDLLYSLESERKQTKASVLSNCLVHTGKPTDVAASHCITWFQLTLTMCQIHYHTLRSATTPVVGSL